MNDNVTTNNSVNKTSRTNWFDNPDILTTVIILLSVVIVLISQAMAVNSDVSGFLMIRNLFNHNITYIAAIIYFIFLKTRIGRRNFNLITVVYILLYVLNTVASVFTIFQSFTLPSIISFVLNFLILCYMCYTFLPDTRFWKELNFDKLPLDEIKNDWFFYVITLVSLALLLVNLIYSVDFYGIITTLFDTFFIIIFSRYIYLYKNYIELGTLKRIEAKVKKQIEENTKKSKKKDETNEEKEDDK